MFDNVKLKIIEMLTNFFKLPTVEKTAIVSIFVTGVFSLLIYLGNRKSNEINNKLLKIEEGRKKKENIEKEQYTKQRSHELYIYFKLSVQSLAISYASFNRKNAGNVSLYDWNYNIADLREHLTHKEIDFLYEFYHDIKRLNAIQKKESDLYYYQFKEVCSKYLYTVVIENYSYDINHEFLIYCRLPILKTMSKLIIIFSNEKDPYDLNLVIRNVDNETEELTLKVHDSLEVLCYKNNELTRIELKLLNESLQSFPDIKMNIIKFFESHKLSKIYLEQLEQTLNNPITLYNMNEDDIEIFEYFPLWIEQKENAINSKKIGYTKNGKLNGIGYFTSDLHSKPDETIHYIGHFKNDEMMDGLYVIIRNARFTKQIFEVKDKMIVRSRWINRNESDFDIIFQDNESIGYGTHYYRNTGLMYTGSLKKGGAPHGFGYLKDDSGTLLIKGEFENYKLKNGYIYRCTLFDRYDRFISEKGIGAFLSRLKDIARRIPNFDIDLRFFIHYRYEGNIKDFMLNDDSGKIYIGNTLMFEGEFIDGIPVDEITFIDNLTNQLVLDFNQVTSEIKQLSKIYSEAFIYE